MGNFKEVKTKIINPIYTIGIIWFIYGLIFPLYRITDLLIVAGLSIIIFIFASKLIPEHTTVVPITATGNIDEKRARILEKGHEYVNSLKEAKDKINDAKMSSQVEEVVGISRQMLDYIIKNPEHSSDLGNFIDYYYPTTLKLLNSYLDVKKQEVTSGNSESIAKKVSSVMDTIVTAFKKQLDQLYAHKALDIKTDIDVLKNVLASEGLTDGDQLINRR